MNHLTTLTDQDIFGAANEVSYDDFNKRRAARAIVFSQTGEIYLLKMATQNYHKLPGGGVDDGESLEAAVYRELIEEIGCPATIEQEVGEIEEYRNDWKLHQVSYCYIARQNGALVDTALEENEIADGAETIVVKSIDEAIFLLENDQPLNYDGKFIQQRDLHFLREAKKILT